MDIIGKDNTMNSMAWELAKLLGLYLVAPMLIAAIIFKLFNIPRKVISVLVGIVGLIGLYYLGTVGLN